MYVRKVWLLTIVYRPPHLCAIDKLRLFIPNSHSEITHMPSYYYISLRQRDREQSNYAFRSMDMSE